MTGVDFCEVEENVVRFFVVVADEGFIVVDDIVVGLFVVVRDVDLIVVGVDLVVNVHVGILVVGLNQSKSFTFIYK